MLTHEQTMDLIRSYIDDIKKFMDEKDLTMEKKHALERAFSVYNGLYQDAERGKIDPDLLHENISSFLYMLQ